MSSSSSGGPSDVPPHSGFDERRWVIHLRRSLEEEIEDKSEIDSVSIFGVPKTLMAADPDSYVPQQVAIGPYHCRRLELFDMERYKLASAKRAQKNLQSGFKFHHFVEQVMKLEHKIRAQYHKFLNCNSDTLGWMMAVDAAFVLEFLQLYTIEQEERHKKSSHNAILRDMVMLENQIPLFVLRKLMEFQFSSSELADNSLTRMLIGFCKEISPLKMTQSLDITKCSHLLDVMYRLVALVPECHDYSEGKTEESHDMSQKSNQGETTSSLGQPGYKIKHLANQAWKIIVGKINGGPTRLVRRIMFLMPWKMLSVVPGLRFVVLPIEYMCFSRERNGGNPESKNLQDANKPPLVEEIEIPSVSELAEAGVSFVATNEGIGSIHFDENEVALYLPSISLDLNTEVLLRNLIAYEACNTSGPVVFTRYTELMNGIIDIAKDVKLLREKKIIFNRLKSDDEVARLWNGMSRSVRLTKVPFLDKAIEDVNKYYKGRWKVKIGNIMKHYVFGSWRFLTLLAAIMLLLLMSLQVVCSVSSCARLNKHVKSNISSN